MLRTQLQSPTMIVARLTFLMLALGACLGASRAAAMEVTCIEGSRYKHLFQIFGNDPKKFADYLQIDAKRLPSPELCRAALITGPIESTTAQEVSKLADFITKNEGWLAALHLSSGGGSVATGYQLGFLARTFWLKTYTARSPNGTLAYLPDFYVPPLAPAGTAASDAAVAPAPTPELVQGWQAYLSERKKFGPQKAGSVCASACGLIHSAGIERFGAVHVHRSRYVGKDSAIDQSKSMSATIQGLMRSEESQVAFYAQMDAGPEFIRNYLTTPPETTTPVDLSRYPRYVADYLNARCGADVGQLQRLERQIDDTISHLAVALFGISIKVDHLRTALQKVREQRGTAERCVAAAHEKERLDAYDKLCGSRGSCSASKLVGMADGKARELAKGVK
jgi:hypothetical protein